MFSSPLHIITVGHVDHGKSTLLGRLLYDTDSLSNQQKQALQVVEAGENNQVEWASLLDAFLEEQAQNITIDTTQFVFRTPQRGYVMIDAPGHQEFLKNMITGATRADAALLIIDVADGIQEQTRRHLQLLSLVGIKQVIVLFNKMDLINYELSLFEERAREVERLFEQYSLDFLPNSTTAANCCVAPVLASSSTSCTLPVCAPETPCTSSPAVSFSKSLFLPSQIIPIVARSGENVVTYSSKMNWYQGPTLLQVLESIPSPLSLENKPLRFLVQDVYCFDERRLIVGRVESGTLRVGEEIIFWPGGKRSPIRSIEEWGAVEQPKSAVAGKSIAITLEKPLFVERGYIASTQSDFPSEAREFSARLFWLDREPLSLNQMVKLQLGTQSVVGNVTAIKNLMTGNTVTNFDKSSSHLHQHDVADVIFSLMRPIVYDEYEKIAATGRFAVVVKEHIGGGGVISSGCRKEALDCKGKQFGHQGAILWLTGLSGSGKSTIARGLEALLQARGMAATILDGDHLRQGLCSDLGFSMADRAENVRRTGEVAKLFAEAGLIVIGALISPFAAPREQVKASCLRDGIIFKEIFVDAPLEVCEARDPRGLYQKARRGEIEHFTGITSPYEIPIAADVHLLTASSSSEETIKQLYETVLSWLNIDASFQT
jgi:bifunctional enzyme CysN/CysC